MARTPCGRSSLPAAPREQPTPVVSCPPWAAESWLPLRGGARLRASCQGGACRRVVLKLFPLAGCVKEKPQKQVIGQLAPATPSNDPRRSLRTDEERALTDTPDALCAAVEQRFAQVARSPDQETKVPVGSASAKKLGYDPQEVDPLPAPVTESFCGVGHPQGLGEVFPGQAVLDLGSGPGLDTNVHPVAALENLTVPPEGEARGRGADMPALLCPEAGEGSGKTAGPLPVPLGSVSGVPTASHGPGVLLDYPISALCEGLITMPPLP
jgi:hypothetical protein